MTKEQVQQVLDELQGVRPEMLNGEAKRLFEAIMKIADERDKIEQEYDRDTHILQNQLDLANAKNIEKDKIIDLMLKEVERRMKEQGIELKIEKSVKKLVTEKGIDKSYGARPLRRTIQNIVEDSLAEYILDGKIKAGEEVKIAAKDGKIIVK